MALAVALVTATEAAREAVEEMSAVKVAPTVEVAREEVPTGAVVMVVAAMGAVASAHPRHEQSR